jgi:hypothetical protein
MQAELAILKAKENLAWTEGFVKVYVNQEAAKTAAAQAGDDHIHTLAELALQNQLKLQQPQPQQNAQ